jgi:hypothetical protein
MNKPRIRVFTKSRNMILNEVEKKPLHYNWTKDHTLRKCGLYEQVVTRTTDDTIIQVNYFYDLRQ